MATFESHNLKFLFESGSAPKKNGKNITKNLLVKKIVCKFAP